MNTNEFMANAHQTNLNKLWILAVAKGHVEQVAALLAELCNAHGAFIGWEPEGFADELLSLYVPTSREEAFLALAEEDWRVTILKD